MTLEHDLQRLEEQHRRLTFAQCSADTVWQLGTKLKARAEARGAAVTIEIRIARETQFFYAMPGTTPGNADWARRKRNTVDLLQKSSYHVGRELERDKTSLEAKMNLPSRDYASHGGSFPIQVTGLGCVGTVTVSGLPQREDHVLLVEVLAELCGVPLEDVALA